ncbi:response regulator transcription factor [Microbacterium sp. zg-YB36]|uniref:response regulator transcription factor n=1 Tax=Microbacterium sp. zg-YB36 TaxID=2969407 RepID=UPI00214AC8EA|nr:response regulator transcription factor [Microbacterium sp. zg-YB36]MDL5352312.1 response regulator transcription factor [Microbacterium sp. zg-YB36]
MTDSTAPPKTAVIVEDDPDIRHLLVEVLGAMGFATVSVDNGVDGVEAVLAYQPLITTLDVNMPGIDGFEAARRIRAQSDTYIIMLTGLEEEADVLLGFGAGADEYIYKPFRPRELRARIDALLRRPRIGGDTANVGQQHQSAPTFAGAQLATAVLPALHPPEPAPPQPHPHGRLGAGALAHRDLELDPDSRIVIAAGQELELTRTEFDLLSTLMESKRRVRSKADLTLVVRADSYVTNYYVGEADKRAIEAHMTNLRRKLGDSAALPRYIETVRGVGYRMTSDSAD